MFQPLRCRLVCQLQRYFLDPIFLSLCDLTIVNDNNFLKENCIFAIRGVNLTLLVSSINRSLLLYETTQLRNFYHVSTKFFSYCHFASQSLTADFSFYFLGNSRLHSLILCHRQVSQSNLVVNNAKIGHTCTQQLLFAIICS